MCSNAVFLVWCILWKSAERQVHNVNLPFSERLFYVFGEFFAKFVTSKCKKALSVFDYNTEDKSRRCRYFFISTSFLILERCRKWWKTTNINKAVKTIRKHYISNLLIVTQLLTIIIITSFTASLLRPPFPCEYISLQQSNIIFETNSYQSTPRRIRVHSVLA